jgi:polyphosphate kinase
LPRAVYPLAAARRPAVGTFPVDGGILLIGMPEQERRFQTRIHDPLHHWKLSPMDIEPCRRRYDYSEARDAMLKAPHTRHAP